MASVVGAGVKSESLSESESSHYSALIAPNRLSGFAEPLIIIFLLPHNILNIVTETSSLKSLTLYIMLL